MFSKVFQVNSLHNVTNIDTSTKLGKFRLIYSYITYFNNAVIGKIVLRREEPLPNARLEIYCAVYVYIRAQT